MSLERHRTKSRAARLALGLAFSALLLYLAEIALRIGGVGPAYQAGITNSWRMNPNLVDRPLQGPRDVRSFSVSTNADGLRTRVPVERTTGVARVAVLGDSTVFGWGVADDGTVADGIQRGLDAVRPGAAEVLNAGQPGYSTTQAAWLFREVVAAYRPDRTVVFIPAHDINRVPVSDRELLHGGEGLGARLRVTLALHSRLYQVLRQAIWPMTDKPALLPSEESSEPRVPRVSDEERTLALDEMRALAATWGGEVYVGFLPFQRDLEEGPKSRPSLDWGLAYARETGAPLVDVRGAARGKEYLLPDDPGHLTADGNRLAGEAAAPILARALGW